MMKKLMTCLGALLFSAQAVLALTNPHLPGTWWRGTRVEIGPTYVLREPIVMQVQGRSDGELIFRSVTQVPGRGLVKSALYLHANGKVKGFSQYEGSVAPLSVVIGHWQSSDRLLVQTVPAQARLTESASRTEYRVESDSMRYVTSTSSGIRISGVLHRFNPDDTIEPWSSLVHNGELLQVPTSSSQILHKPAGAVTPRMLQASSLSSTDPALDAFAADPTSNPNFSTTGWQDGLLSQATPQQFRNSLRALNIIYNPPPSVAVASITWNLGVATVTLASAPNLPLITGDTFALSGATPSDYNTGWQVASVIDSTHFTFSTSGSSISSGASGTIALQQTAQLNVSAFGDSVAGKKPAYLFPEITRAIPPNSIQSDTHAIGGDAVDNTADFTIEAAGGSISIGSGTGWVTFGTGGSNPKCDTVTVIYAKESGAGIFKLQASTDVGTPKTWTDISGYTAIDASSASLAAGVITLKVPYGYYGVRAVHISGGAVRIARFIYRAESQNGWNRNDFTRGGIAQQQMSGEQSDFQSAEVAAVNPTLISSEWKDSQPTVAIYLGPLVAAFQSIKNADWIFNATTPVSSDAAYDTNPTKSPTYLENLETEKVAKAGGWYYFSEGWWMWQKYSELARLGLQGDGTHVSTTADYEMAAVEARDLWFLCAPPGIRSAVTDYVSNTLGVGGSPSTPSVSWTTNPGTGDVTQKQGTGNFTYFDDANGNPVMILSSHPQQYSNPSMLPANILFGAVATGAMFQVDPVSHAVLWRTAPGNATTNYYSDVDAPLRALNVPAYFQQGGTYTLICGVGAIATNSTGNFSLPVTPKQNGIYSISASNVGWKLHQSPGQIIRSGPHATTLGINGGIIGTNTDSITLLYTGVFSGIQEWRVIAGGESSTLSWN
jgi:hypothetical protein